MHRTQETDHSPFALDTRCLPWVQRSMFTWHEGEATAGSCTGQQGFDIGFHIIEVDIISTVRPTLSKTTATNYARQHRLLLQTFELPNKTQATFEQAHTRLLTIQVVFKCLDQTRPQGRAQIGRAS